MTEAGECRRQLRLVWQQTEGPGIKSRPGCTVAQLKELEHGLDVFCQEKRSCG